MELILVLLIITLLFALAWPSFRVLMDGGKLSAAGAELRAALREARRQAITSNVPHRLEIDARGAWWRIVPVDPAEDSRAVSLPPPVQRGGFAQPAPPRPPGAIQDAENAEWDETDSTEPTEHQLEFGIRISIQRFEPDWSGVLGDRTALPRSSHERREKRPTELSAGRQSREFQPLPREPLDNDADAEGQADESADLAPAEPWRPVTEVFPDGTMSPIRLRLQDRQRRWIVLRVVASTGEVELTGVTEEEAEAMPGENRRSAPAKRERQP